MNLPPELIESILLTSTYDTILHYCQTDKEANKLCTDTHFWLKKLDHDFTKHLSKGQPRVPSTYAKQYATPGESSIKTYSRWHTVFSNPISDSSIIDMIDQTQNPESNLDIILFRLDMMYDANPRVIDIIKNNSDYYNYILITYGYPVVLEWLYNKGVVPNTTLTYIYNELSFNVIRWLISHGIAPTQNDMDEITNVSVIEWLIDQNFIPHSSHFANIAFAENNTRLLDKLAARNIVPNIYSIDNTLGSSYINSNINPHTLQWLSQHNILPSVRGANDAINRDIPDWSVLEWLAQHGVLPDQHGANQVIYTKLDTLKRFEWLNKHGVIPGISVVYNAIKFDKVDVLYWLARHGFVPDQKVMNYAILQPNINFTVLDWLVKEFHLIPNQEVIDAIVAVPHDPLPILIWLQRHGLLPGRASANIALHRGRFEVVKWLALYNIIPDAAAVRLATANRVTGITQWLSTHPKISEITAPAFIVPNYIINPNGLIPHSGVSINISSLPILGNGGQTFNTNIPELPSLQYSTLGFSDQINRVAPNTVQSNKSERVLLSVPIPTTNVSQQILPRVPSFNVQNSIATTVHIPTIQASVPQQVSPNVNIQSNNVVTQIPISTIQASIPQQMLPRVPSFNAQNSIVTQIPIPIIQASTPQQVIQEVPSFNTRSNNAITIQGSMPQQLLPSMSIPVLQSNATQHVLPTIPIPTPQFGTSHQMLPSIINPSITLVQPITGPIPSPIVSTPFNTSALGVNYEIVNPNNSNQVFNPKSGRWIMKNKSTYNDLVAQGIIIPR